MDLASPAEQSDDEDDHRCSEENMDQTAPDVEREVPEQPENEKDHGDTQHDFCLAFRSGIVSRLSRRPVTDRAGLRGQSTGQDWQEEDA